MAVKAYVLIEVDVGKASEVVEAVQKLEGVKSADSVTGPYDVVAAIDVADVESMGSVMKQIHSVTGVCKTTTLVVVRF